MPKGIDEEFPSQPQQIFPIVMDYVTAYTQNPDPRYIKAGMFRIFHLLISKLFRLGKFINLGFGCPMNS
ncbi:hypothetical protein Glove_219g51 [Diversispora epigaea]|uniref:Uncharacterized protein n=1 Tax=Diversispora epigaea TaxID=1348612 RepID=A0A397IG71_9GLOM|nr:hypothetical protein Glove_219g51 [Diversispora epigaea]